MPFPKDKLVATEYQPFDQGQPPVHFGEKTGIQSVITSPWVLRWASIPATYATYREIRKHGTLALARELKVAPVLASEWTIDADDGVPQEWKDLVEKIFFLQRDDFMAPALYYGDVDFGYTCFEKIIEPKDGYVKIVRFKPLLHDITEICIGHKGGFIGVRQLGHDLGIHNSVHVGFRVEGSYLYGVPLLENARQAYNWWIDCNEGARRYDRKIAGAHIVVEYPVGSSTDRNGKEVENATLARTVLDSLEAAGGVAIPRDMAAFMQQLNLESPGWKIWILDAGSNQQGTFVARLEYLDKMLCRSLHIPERAMMEGQHGTKAEAEAHADVIFTIQDIEHRRVTAELNKQAVDQVLFLNFGAQAVGKVRLKACPIVDEKKQFFKEIYMQLLGSPAGQKELDSLDAGSLRKQLGLPQVQNDPGDVEREGANLQAIPGLSAGQPGGAGKQLLARGSDGQPVTVDGQAENPAAALANAVWGMREAIALSSTALEKAEAAERGRGERERGRRGEREAEPLELAATEPVEQEPWQEDERLAGSELGYKKKSVQLGPHDYLNFEAYSSEDEKHPQIERVRRQEGLDHPHEVLMSRGPTRDATSGTLRMNKQGKAMQMMSHSAQAVRELVNRFRPVAVEWSAAGDEPSRQDAYHHLLRRLAKEDVGGGEYVFLHEPAYTRRSSHGRKIYEPAYFHIVHKSVAHLEPYRNMDSALEQEPVMASGATFADVLAVRPIGGRLAEDMNTVAMANHRDWLGPQRKTIAPAIDAAEKAGRGNAGRLSPGMQVLLALRARRQGLHDGYANMSPGQRILFEMRARKGAGIGMSNIAPEPEKLSTRPAPVEYWKPTAENPPEFARTEDGGGNAHEMLTNLYNNAIHKAPEHLKEFVKGTPPENFLQGTAPLAHHAIHALGVGTGVFKNGSWMWPEARRNLIEHVPYEMVRSEQVKPADTVRKGVTDLESYDPENPSHGSFPEYFGKVRSRVVNGLVSNAIKEKLGPLPEDVRRSHIKGAGIVPRKKKPEVTPQYKSHEYPAYDMDDLDHQMHAYIRAQVNPKFVDPVTFVYDALRAGKHPAWTAGNSHLGGTAGPTQANLYAKELSQLGDELAAKLNNKEFSRRARITDEGRNSAMQAISRAGKRQKYPFMSDSHRQAFGPHLEQFVKEKIAAKKLGPGALHAARELMAGKTSSEVRMDKKTASNNSAAFNLIRDLRRSMPEFWRQVGDERMAAYWEQRLEAEGKQGRGAKGGSAEKVPLPRYPSTLLDREAALKNLDRAKLNRGPIIDDIYDSLDSQLGPNGSRLLRYFVNGLDEDAVIKKLGIKLDRPRAIHLLETNKEKVARELRMLRERTSTDDKARAAVLDHLGAILNTKHYQDNPVYYSNKTLRTIFRELALTARTQRDIRGGFQA